MIEFWRRGAPRIGQGKSSRSLLADLIYFLLLMPNKRQCVRQYWHGHVTMHTRKKTIEISNRKYPDRPYRHRPTRARRAWLRARWRPACCLRRRRERARSLLPTRRTSTGLSGTLSTRTTESGGRVRACVRCGTSLTVFACSNSTSVLAAKPSRRLKPPRMRCGADAWLG